MIPTVVREFRLALALEAYGVDLRLWKEPGEREWSATLRDDNSIADCHFEEDNLTLAKLHVLGEARSRARSRSGSAELPGCDAFLDSWRVKLTKPARATSPSNLYRVTGPLS
jgi:hypothetical protein